MLTVVIKEPDFPPAVKEIHSSLEALEEILEGEFELIQDDHLKDIVFLVNEEARGIKANNFPVSTDGFLDWVYGTCIVVKAENQAFSSLTDEDIQTVMEYFSRQTK